MRFCVHYAAYFIVLNVVQIVSSTTLTGSGALLTLIVGPHKTGSTTIEDLIYSLKSPITKMLHEDKINIPVFNYEPNVTTTSEYHDFGKNADYLAQDIVHGVIERSSAIRVLQRALQSREHGQVIVAAESLCLVNVTEPGFALLKTALPMLRVVVSMRDIPDWIRSGYHQWKAGKSFSEWVKSRSYEEYAHRNPHAVTRKFVEEGISVAQYRFMDMNALFCAVLNAPTACRYARSGMMNIPHKNDRSANQASECADAIDVQKMAEFFTTHHAVPGGQYNWSKLCCV